MGHSPVNGRLLPTFLGFACLVPTGFGIFRALDIARSGDWALRFVADAVDHLPLFLHVIGASAFVVLGAIQILPGTRHRHPRWHQRAGRFVAPAGLIGAVSGVWMTLAHPAISGELLYWGRLASGSAWTVFILLSLAMIGRRNFKAHGRWMIRAYALALPAGTLAFILLPIVLIWGEENTEHLGEVIQVIAWALHLAVAEWLIQRKSRAAALRSQATA